MKILRRLYINNGSTLLACLSVAVVTGILLMSYLVLTHQQFTSVVRSEYWNRAIVVSEAGIEDGLQMINKYASFPGLLDNWNLPASLSADNWTTYSNNCYHVTRTIGPDSYDAFIMITGATPVVTATANVGLPYKSYSLAQTPMFAAAGVTIPQLKRQIQVGTRRDPLFSVAMAALNSIDLNGKKITTDSFDSGDPLYNSNGMYSASFSKSAGDLVTDGQLIDSLNIGNATVNGMVKTGPSGTITIGSQGSVGDKTFTSDPSNKGKIQDGWKATDMNVVFGNVTLPGTFPDPVPTVTVTNNDGTVYDHAILYSGNYYTSDLAGKIYIAPGVQANISLTGSYNQTGSDVIKIDSNSGGVNSGKLTIYAAGPTFKVAGGGIVNGDGTTTYPGNAANFTLFGLTNLTSIDFQGNASFTGVIYAPQAEFTLGGGGSDDYDFVGSSVTKSVKMNGNYQFHYDENLRDVGPTRAFIPTWWVEKQVSSN